MLGNLNNIGVKLRELRTAKGKTINQIAKETGLTSSFISQFERGLTTASIASIQRITKALNENLSSLFTDDDPQVIDQNQKPVVMRKSQRRILTYPSPENTVDYLLTGLGGRFEVIYSKVEPGGGSGEPYTHDSDEECIIIIRGIMEVIIGELKYVLEEGDSVTFCSRIPHGWKNAGSDSLEVIWVIAPPTY